MSLIQHAFSHSESEVCRGGLYNRSYDAVGYRTISQPASLRMCFSPNTGQENAAEFVSLRGSGSYARYGRSILAGAVTAAYLRKEIALLTSDKLQFDVPLGVVDVTQQTDVTTHKWTPAHCVPGGRKQKCRLLPRIQQNIGLKK